MFSLKCKVADQKIIAESKFDDIEIHSHFDTYARLSN